MGRVWRQSRNRNASTPSLRPHLLSAFHLQYTVFISPRGNMLLLIIWSLKHWEWLATELWQWVNKRPNEEQKILPVAVEKYCPREIINQTPWCEVKKYICCPGSLINAGVGRLVTKQICHWVSLKFWSTSARGSEMPEQGRARATFPELVRALGTVWQKQGAQSPLCLSFPEPRSPLLFLLVSFFCCLCV